MAMAAALAEQARQAQEKARQVRRVTPTRDHVRGNRDGELSLIEYSDFECPFCGRYAAETYPKILEDYIKTGKIRYYYRDFPLLEHPHRRGAARAANRSG